VKVVIADRKSKKWSQLIGSRAAALAGDHDHLPDHKDRHVFRPANTRAKDLYASATFSETGLLT
jgi:hypothetical protein